MNIIDNANNLLEKYDNIITDLYEQYKNNNYIMNKLDNHITGLPDMLRNIDEEYNKRNIRRNELTKETELFVNNFLMNNHYYYIPNSELFITYNEEHYKLVSEDNILHNILTSISGNQNILQTWKYKIKTHIIKLIKQTPINSSIPESFTIQHVLSNLHPNIFGNKNQTKYFLTIIGDAILKKEENNIHIVSPESKEFLNIFSQHLYLLLNKSYIDNFKYKYYDYDFALCRLVNIKNNITDKLTTFLKNNMLDIISVSCHYSNRYGSADLFLRDNCNDNTYVDNVLFLKNNTGDDIIKIFINDFTQSDDKNIPYKNMYLLWRQFLKKYNLPFIVSHANLKKHLKQLDIYDETTDMCKNISSKESVDLTYFQQFWNDNIIVDSEEADDILEIEEIYTMFNDWCKESERKIITNLNEDKVREIINWINPNINIENDKYIYNILCKLWNKRANIELALQSIDATSQKDLSALQKYKLYCKFVKQNSDNSIKSSKYIVSKQYFEDFISSTLNSSTSAVSLMSLGSLSG